MISATYQHSSTELYVQKHSKNDIYNLKYGGDESSNIRQNEREKTGALLILNMILSSLNLSRNSAILNIGINDGREMRGFNFSNMFGIDLSTSALKRGLKLFPNLKFFLASAENLPFKANNFDLIISLRTLQCSLINKEKAIREIKRVIKDRHAVIISSPTGYLSEDGGIVEGLMSNGQIDPKRAEREIEILKRFLLKEDFEIIEVIQTPIETFILSLANKMNKSNK
jgi:SAM-dependent methyltransferase